MQKLKIVAILLTVILAILLVMAFITYHNAEKEKLQNAVRIEKMVNSLYTKISALERERQSLERLYDPQINGVGTVGLLYINADRTVYEIAYPQMVEYGYSGLIALSDDSFPDEEGCMNSAQFSELLTAGWKWCVTFPVDSKTPEADVDSLVARALAAGLGRSNMIYFPSGSYTSEYEAWLSAHGFDIVIYLESSIGSATDQETWYAEAVSWRSHLRRQYLSAAAENYKNILFEINLRSDYLDLDTTYHSSLLGVLSQYCTREEIKLLTPDEAKNYRFAVEAGREDAVKELRSKQEEIDAQIQAILAEIEEICRTFDATKDT